MFFHGIDHKTIPDLVITLNTVNNGVCLLSIKNSICLLTYVVSVWKNINYAIILVGLSILTNLPNTC